MLDSPTKRRIDGARDVLVGKVPDPKSQVEQITIALIYKFMDDLDAESEELGGTRTFFAGEFARYGWAKLMRSGLGGHETLNLYAEAVTRMPENPGIPPLFRDIFKNAYLPYRDPETLRAFLKIIDEFIYDHSERLGDAFEYLLSVLGSQGDAGQFRTPRHIIDFIVAVLDPKKDETILDPACGTAGFLISSYKHILRANVDKDGNNALTPDDKGRLATNFKGYDISPDMVRLSLVNMYLHGFVAPHIFEYDTLTSEDRWSEYADVILANPPFMSPKGGIRPHGRFSVQSRRSEVLFVDYMAEHLTPNGRAGIIVPEGIIFQSQNAHKQLRKLLIEEHLVAVVSLPAGVFQPYAGVKTSVLILDKSLAKKTDRIAFFKVENDGFDLGAQRRPIAANDLPSVHAEIAEYLGCLRAGKSVDASRVAEPGTQYTTERRLVVGKDRVAESGDYNLNGDRYRESSKRASEFPYVSLDKVAEIVAGNSAPQGTEYFEDGRFPFIRTSDVGAVHRSDNFSGTADKVNQKAVDELRLRLFPPGTILFPKSGASTFLNHRVLISEAAYVSSHLAGIICDEHKVLPKYVYNLLCWTDARAITPDQAYPSLRLKEIGNIEIPLPPLDVQREIVAEIEGYQQVINGVRQIIHNYRSTITVDPKWSLVPLGSVCDVVAGQSPPGESYNTTEQGTPFYQGKTEFGPMFIGEPVKWTTNPQRFAEMGDILMSVRAPVGPVNLATEHVCIGRGLAAIKPQENNVIPTYVFYILRTMESQITGDMGATFASISKQNIEAIPIPLPPMEIQQGIVKELEMEQSLVDANRELSDRMERKIQLAINHVWGK